MKSFDCKQCAVSAHQGQTLTSFFKRLIRGGKARTGTATVKGHRMASARMPTADSTWDHWVTFALTDGGEMELIVQEAQFRELKAGQTGLLTWEGETLLSFDALVQSP